MTRGNGRKKPTRIRCAIYTRKSHEDGLDQEYNSLDAQRDAGEAYVASQKGEGWTLLPDRYDDGGFSGGNIERPALKQLMADIEAGKVDCVVVYKVDRLSRSLFDFARLVEVFERHGVSFVSVTQHFNTTDSMGRLTLNILLSFAQFEREIIGERIRDKIAAQRRRGKWTGGTPVLGYDVDRSGDSPKLVVNREEATRVRAIFDLYVEHESLLAVVETLEARKWANKAWTTRRGKPKGGRPFDKGSLHALLTNPLYVGRIRSGDMIFEGEHEPIVPPCVFRDVQDVLRRNARSGGPRNKHAAMLKGILVCKACGRAMTHTFTDRGNKRYRYYTCSRIIKSGRRSCRTRSLPAAEIEGAVVDEIRGVAGDERLRAAVLAKAREHHDAERDATRAERGDLERELGRLQRELAEAAERGNVDLAAELQERITRAEWWLADVARRIEEIEADAVSAADVAAAFDDFDGLWESLSPRDRAEVLGLLVAKVEYDAAQGEIAVTLHPTGIRSLNRRREEAA